MSKRGAISFYMNQPELAIQEYSRAISVDPQYVTGYFGRAQTYSAQKKYELAIDDFTRAINLDQRFADAIAFRGLLCFRQAGSTRAPGF
jgi:tetratricopeptide (TPR) repeat protein